jgi:hypothetical protein
MVPISSDSQDVTGQTVNYFFPVLKDAEMRLGTGGMVEEEK